LQFAQTLGLMLAGDEQLGLVSALDQVKEIDLD